MNFPLWLIPIIIVPIIIAIYSQKASPEVSPKARKSLIALTVIGVILLLALTLILFFAR